MLKEFPSLVTLLQLRLQRAIYLQRDSTAASSAKVAQNPVKQGFVTQNLGQKNSLIRLKRVKNTTQVVYASAIAHQLAARSQDSALSLAQQIVEFVSNDTFTSTIQAISPVSANTIQDVKIQAMPSGLIQFELGDLAIAAWLDFIVHQPIQLEQSPDFIESQIETASQLLFAAQHAHARCCSWLRLAHQQSLIQLNQALSTQTLSWQWIQPDPIPWLTLDRQLYLNQPADWQLIQQLIDSVDFLFSNRSTTDRVSATKFTHELTLAFHAFHKANPIWGEVRGTIAPSIPAKLGLLFVTQRILRVLLEDYLHLPAPVEL